MNVIVTSVGQRVVDGGDIVMTRTVSVKYASSFLVPFLRKHRIDFILSRIVKSGGVRWK